MFITAMGIVLPAGVQAGTELIINGGFEQDGYKFTAYGNWGGTYASIVSEGAHSGSKCARIKTENGGAPYIYQSVAVTGGNTYKISFWYKGEVADKGFHIEMEEYNSSRRNYAEQSSPLLYSASGWTYVEHEFVPQANTVSILVMPRITASSATIYIDDLSLQLVHEGPFQFEFDTDWVFYYQEYTEATVTVTMDDYYEDTGYTADVTLKKGFKTLVSETGLPFANNKMVYKLDITGMDKKKDYPLTVTIKDKDGKAVKTFTQNIYRIDRPTMLTGDGVFMNNGVPFDPVIGYHLFDAAHYKSASEGGINVIQWPASGSPDELIEQLDYIHSLGMKVLAGPARRSWPAGHPGNAERTALVAETIKDHPAVLGYIIADEPFSHNAYADKELEDSYRIIRYIDDKHPVYLCADHSYRRSSKYVDALGIDPYPGNGFDFGKHVGDKVAQAVAECKYERPVYTIVQAFTWVDGTPTTDQVRTQLLQAMMAGAKGIGYYVWENTTDGNLDKGPWWDTIKAFANSESSVLFESFARGESNTFNAFSNTEVWYQSRISGNDVYMAVVNRTKAYARPSISLKSTNGKVALENCGITVIGGGDNLNIIQNGTSFDITLAANQSVLLKISPETLPDYSKLGDKVLNGDFESIVNNMAEGWGLAAGGGAAVPTPAEAFITENGNHFIMLTRAATRVDQTIYLEPGKKYVMTAEYKASGSGGVIEVDMSPSWRGVTKSLAAVSDWTKINMMFDLTKEDNGMAVVRLRNWTDGTIVCFDNISITEFDSRGKLLFTDDKFAAVKSLSDVSGSLWVHTQGQNAGDRLYVAVYKNTDGELRLCDIKCVTAQDDSLISCEVNMEDKTYCTAKAFLWTPAMGTKLNNILE